MYSVGALALRYIDHTVPEVIVTIFTVIITVFMDQAAGHAAYPIVRDMFPDLQQKSKSDIHKKINEKVEDKSNKSEKRGGGNPSDNP